MSDHICDPTRPLLKDGMKHHRNPAVKVPISTLPVNILINHEYIKIHMNFFYINVMPFFHKKTYKITFLTKETISSMSADNIIQELHAIANMYTSRCFHISVYHGDN